MASRVGSATALSLRATDSVRARAMTSPCPTPIPMMTRPSTSMYMHEPKKRQGTNRRGWPASTPARISGIRAARMSHPPGIKSSSDCPRSYCATTWRPASSMMGSACCHMSSTGAQTSSKRSRYDRRRAGDSRSMRKRERYISRSSGVSEGMDRSRGTVATACSMADHSSSGSVVATAPACWARTCISVKQVSSEPSQKSRTRSARSSRPVNISANFGYRACMEGRAATDRSQERSVANEGVADTAFSGGSSIASVNIGIRLY